MSNKFTSIKLIQFCLIFSLFAYGMVIVITSQAANQTDVDSVNLIDENFKMILSGLGFFMSIVSFVMYRLLMTADKIQSKPNPLAYFITIHIIVWAIFESCAIFGLMIAFITHNIYDYLPFAIVSAIGILLHSAQEAKYQKLASNGR